MLDERSSKGMQLMLVIAVAIGLLFQCDLSSGMGICLLPFAYLAGFGCACLLALDALITKLRRKPAPHLKTALLLAIVLALGPAFPWVNVPFCWLSAAHKLLRNQSHYTELVQRAEAGRAVPEFYLTEKGPPALYSVCWGGIADNWYGVVHDRSQTFADAPRDVLGGALVRQLHLWGPWYYVQFT